MSLLLAAVAGPAIAVLFAQRELHLAPDLPRPAARYVPLEGFRNPGWRARTVVLGGHSVPPTYVGQPPAAVAAAIASFRPSVVVLETCYGASTPLLGALAATGLRAWVVAAPYQLPVRNLRYAPAFFTAAAPRARLDAVATVPPYPLLRWRLEPGAIARVEAEVAAMGPDALRARLKRVRPALVRMPMPGALAPRGVVLVPVEAARFRPLAPATSLAAPSRP